MKKLLIITILIMAIALLLSACAEDTDVTVVSITISKGTLSSTYQVGDEINLEETTAVIKYSDGSQRLISVLESMISGFSTESEGVGTMTIAYEGVATSFRYTVVNSADTITISGVEASGIPNEFVRGDQLPSDKSYSITATFSDGRTETIRGEYLTIESFSTERVGEFTMIISGETTYGTARVEIKYAVTEHKPAKSFEIQNFPERIIQGQKTTDLFADTVIIPTYENGEVGAPIPYLDSSVKVNYGKNQTIRDKAFTIAGDFTLTITFSGAKLEIEYTVLQKHSDYTVTFNPDVAGMSSTTEKTDNGKIDDLYSSFFVRKGYVIKYWYMVTSENKTVRWDFEKDVFTQDTVLYAFWEKINYSITYVDVSDDSLNKKNNSTYDVETQIILNTEYRTGYTFMGFYKNSLDEGNLLGVDGITLEKGTVGDIVLVAKWAPVAYSITYNYDYQNPATCENPISYNIQTKGVKFNNPERLGYIFEGWMVESTESSLWTVDQVYAGIDAGKTGNIVLKAVWKVIEYKINYVMPSGAIAPGLKSYKITDKDLYLEDGVQANRFFRGWFLNPDLTEEFYKEKGRYVIKAGSYGEITLYPKFVKKYVFDLLLGGGELLWEQQIDSSVSIENNNQIAFGEDSETIILPKLERQYSQFVNWQYLGADIAMRISVEEFLSVPKEGYHFVLSPLWHNTRYTLVYNYGYQVRDENTDEYVAKTESTQFDFYHTVDLHSGVSRNGYIFQGWKNDATQEMISSIREKTVHTDVSVTAQWEIIEYSITKDYVRNDYVADGNVENVATYTVEDTVIFDNPTCDTHVFLGWYHADNPDGEAITEIEKGSIGSVHLIAKWAIKVFKINYINVNPEELHVKTVYEFQCGTTTKINLYGATRTGYTFVNWYADEAMQQRITYLDVSKAREDVTVYGHWSINNYTITYNNMSGATSTNPKTYTINDEIIFQPGSKNGYNFIGWFSQNGSTSGEWGNEIKSIPSGSTGTLSLYARFELATYNLVYHLGYGEPERTQTVQFSLTQVVVPYMPTRQHYKFIAWYIDEERTVFAPNKIGGTGFACKDMDLYAAWEYVTYTITFYPVINGIVSAIPEKISINVDDFTQNGYILYDRPLAGYTFGGWYEDDMLSRRISNVLVVGDCVLYGKYTHLTYSVTYHLDGGQNDLSNPHSFTVADTITLKDATKDGYDFGGWYSDIEFTKPITVIQNCSENLDLYAKYLVVYSINYDYGYGKPVSTNLTKYNETETVVLSAPQNVTSGYTFWKWAEMVDGNMEFITQCNGRDYDLVAIYYNSKTTGFDFTISDGTVTVSSYNGGTTAIIPSALGDLSVTIIADSLFANTSLANITIPSGITTIGTSAFAGTNIKTVSLPNSVVSIGNSAFANATSLATVILPDNTSLTKIPDNCFNGCTALKTITIPDSYTIMGMSAFRGSGLTSVSFAPTIISINNSAFADCRSLTTVNFTKDGNGNTALTNIYEKAFANTALISFEIPLSVTNVGKSILSGCSSLVELTINGKHPVCYYFGGDYYENSFEAFIMDGGNITVYRMPVSLERIYFDSRVTSVCDNCLVSIGGTEIEGVSEVYLPTAVLEFGNSLFVDVGGYQYELIASVENLEAYKLANPDFAERFVIS